MLSSGLSSKNLASPRKLLRTTTPGYCGPKNIRKIFSFSPTGRDFPLTERCRISDSRLEASAETDTWLVHTEIARWSVQKPSLYKRSTKLSAQRQTSAAAWETTQIKFRYGKQLYSTHVRMYMYVGVLWNQISTCQASQTTAQRTIPSLLAQTQFVDLAGEPNLQIWLGSASAHLRRQVLVEKTLHTYQQCDNWHASAKLKLWLSWVRKPAWSKELTNAEHKGGSRKRDRAASTKFLQALVSWMTGGVSPPACTPPLSLLSIVSILN